MSKELYELNERLDNELEVLRIKLNIDKEDFIIYLKGYIEFNTKRI